jgi:hypothetical protein
MKRFVGRHILNLLLVVPLGASLVLGGSAAAAQAADSRPSACEVLGVSSQHGAFFTDWSFLARVSSTDETGGAGVWKMLGQRFVLKLHKGQPSVTTTFHVRTQSTSTKVAPKLVACR